METAVIIPARMGSRRFPGKPLTLIAGRPLIQWVYESAGRAVPGGRVAVATDDPGIAEAVRGFGGTALMTATDHPSGSDRVAEAAAQLGLTETDIAVNLQGDQPLVPAGLIEAAVGPLLDDPVLGLATAATPLDPDKVDDPGRVKVVLDDQGYALYFSRSVIPHPRDPGGSVGFLKHLGVYAFRIWCLNRFRKLGPSPLERIEKLEQLRALQAGLKIKVTVVEFDSPAVDQPGDIAKIESLLSGPGGP